MAKTVAGATRGSLSDKAKSKRMMVRLLNEQVAELEKRAKAEGVAASTLARVWIVEKLKGADK